ncbi:MAG: hypothetical protein AAFY46_10280, partial [Planctomycetota bacterium]
MRFVDGLPLAGAVGIIDTLNGQMVANLTAPTPGFSAAFGFDVSMWGTGLVVSHPSPGRVSPIDPVAPGEVYLYNAETAALAGTVLSPSGVAIDAGTAEPAFGFDTDVSSQFVAASEPFLDSNGVEDAGIVYLFDRSSGGLLEVVRPANLQPGDRFGTHLTLTDTHLAVVGRGLSGRPRVYLYRIGPAPEPCVP